MPKVVKSRIRSKKVRSCNIVTKQYLKDRPEIKKTLVMLSNLYGISFSLSLVSVMSCPEIISLRFCIY